MSAGAAAGVAPAAVRAATHGLTGVQLDAPERPLVESIVREVLPQQARLNVVPDYVTNLAGASAGEPGVLIIAGGGSIAYGVTAGGREALAGGYGFLVGDEGSGFWIGREALMAAIRASEGRGRCTALESGVRDAFELTEMRNIIRVVYAAGFQRDRISELTPVVARAADTGDRVAKRILRRAGQYLAITALAVVRKLHAPGEHPHIYLSGGVFDGSSSARSI